MAAGTVRALVIAGGGALSALALAGCAQIQGLSATQLQVIGPVRVALTVCASGSVGCPEGSSNSGQKALAGNLGQVLVGFRIPEAAVPPAGFTSTNGVAVFAPSPTYTAELERLAPAGAGRKWAGYISSTQSYAAPPSPQAFTVQPEFGLGRGADGTPFTTPFPYRAVVGARLVQNSLTPERPVVCGATLAAGADAGWCVDSPAGALVDLVLPTRDLGVRGGGPVSVQAGGLATVPFTLAYSGTASPLVDVQLTAATTAPGGSALPGVGQLIPASNSATTVQVAVGVPAGAAPGDYDVTLAAALAGGQTRTGTATLRVTAPPAAGGGGGQAGGGGPAGGGGATVARPRIRVILPSRLSFRQARRAGIRVLVGSTRVANVRVELFQTTARRPKAARRIRLKSPGPTLVVLRSSVLRPGPYRVLITGEGFRIPRRGVLRVR
ncbi:MAG: hypothetical protein MUE51_07845 [Thermoleophilia bacterium]|jgi:hypothetical protein|nr:hypothetical protein [Thermoleophilia bacterium]